MSKSATLFLFKPVTQPRAQTRGDDWQAFEHWREMGCRPTRTQFTPERRMAVRAAFAMGYSLDDVLLAIEGAAADPAANDKGKFWRPLNDLTDILRTGASVELYAEKGEALRARAAELIARQQAQRDEPPPVELTPEQVAQRRAGLRELARRMSGRGEG